MVSIEVTRSLSAEERALQNQADEGNPFGPPVGPGPNADSMMAAGMGSGVFIRADGMILTNNHVVDHARKITVTIDEKHKLPAKLIGKDTKTDLAVIQVQGGRKDYPTLQFADSEKIQVGDWTVAVGSPFGLNRSVTSGIVSAKGRASMGILDIEDFIQTDAAINPGSSGGPLLNLDGKMIGINTAIFSQGQGFVGIGFAIPARIAREVTQDLLSRGKVLRGWAGIAAQDLDEDLAKYFKAPRQDGALVSNVASHGPAWQAGLREGDVVLSIGKDTIRTASQLKSAVGKASIGSELPIKVARSGDVRELTLRVREEKPSPSENTPNSQAAGTAARNRQSPHPFGLVVEELPSEVIEMLHIPVREGVIIVGVEPGSAGFEAGLSPGDIVLKANEAKIRNGKDFTRATREIRESKSGVFYVLRGPEEKLFIPIKDADAA